MDKKTGVCLLLFLLLALSGCGAEKALTADQIAAVTAAAQEAADPILREYGVTATVTEVETGEHNRKAYGIIHMDIQRADELSLSDRARLALALQEALAGDVGSRAGLDPAQTSLYALLTTDGRGILVTTVQDRITLTEDGQRLIDGLTWEEIDALYPAN